MALPHTDMLHGWMGKFELSFDFLFCCLCSLSHSHSLSFAISGARMWISHFRVQTLCYATASLAAEKQLISVHLNRLKFGGIGAAMVKARFLHKVKPTSITTSQTERLFWHNFLPVYWSSITFESIRITHDTRNHLFFVSLCFNYDFQFSHHPFNSPLV